ncbi:MAG: hypothetical protein JO102_02860 [Elusimicrobia bacterium]|nr:hypothetical protein [Elusimicrobiota bacterium]
MKRAAGSALVETAFAAGVTAVFLAGALAVGRTALARRRTLALARHASALTAMGVPADVVDGELSDYAARLSAGGATWDVGRFTGTPSAGFYHLIGATVHGIASLPRLLGGGEVRWSDRAVVAQEEP